MHIIVDLDIDAIHVLKLFCRRDFCVKCGIMLSYSSFPDSFCLIHTVFTNRLLQKEKEKPKKRKRKKKQTKKQKILKNCEKSVKKFELKVLKFAWIPKTMLILNYGINDKIISVFDLILLRLNEMFSKNVLLRITSLGKIIFRFSKLACNSLRNGSA